jgi:integrase
MAKKNAEGWLRKKQYTDGLTWLFCFQTTRALDGKRVEHSKRVGLVSQFPSEKSAWREVERLGLSRLLDNSVGSEPTFKQLVEHYKLHELERTKGVAVKARETAARDKHNLDGHVLPRWGDKVATSIKPLELEAWFVAMSEGLQWPTVSKIRSAMSQVFNHAKRHNLIPSDCPNAVKLARCKTTSDYEAKVVSPEQMIAILEELDTPTTRLDWMAALLCSATALRPEEVFGLQWSDVAWEKNQINVRRGWSKGRETDGKNEGSMTQVPLHPALAEYLQQWRCETLYSNRLLKNEKDGA